MATPSAAQVFTGVSGGRGDNSGSAPILDQAQDFQPIADAFYRKREAEQVRRAAEQKKADQDWFNLQKGFNPEEVALRDQDEIMSGANEYNDMLVELKMSGANPQDYYSDAGKKAREKEFQIRNLSKASAENQKYDGLVAAALEKKDPSMDRAYAVDWLKRYRALPSIEAQAKMRQEENPFKTVYSFDNTVERVKPFTKDVLVEKGNRTDQISGLNEDAYRAKVRLDLQSPVGQSDFEMWSNTARNEGKTATDYENEVVEYAKGTVKESVKMTYDEPKVGSSGSDSDGGGSGGWQNKLSINIESGKDDRLIQGVPNSIDVKRKGTNDDLPPVEVIGEDGKTTIAFQPIRFLKTKNGWKVYGKRVSKSASSNPYMPQQSTESYETVDYDLNHGTFVSQMNGFDIYKDVEGATKESKSGETKQNSGTEKQSSGAIDYSNLKKKK